MAAMMWPGARIGQCMAVRFEGEISAFSQVTNNLLEAVFEEQGIF